MDDAHWCWRKAAPCLQRICRQAVLQKLAQSVTKQPGPERSEKSCSLSMRLRLVAWSCQGPYPRSRARRFWSAWPPQEASDVEKGAHSWTGAADRPRAAGQPSGWIRIICRGGIQIEKLQICWNSLQCRCCPRSCLSGERRLMVAVTRCK